MLLVNIFFTKIFFRLQSQKYDKFLGDSLNCIHLAKNGLCKVFSEDYFMLISCYSVCNQ